jgi:hypothetical protein
MLESLKNEVVYLCDIKQQQNRHLEESLKQTRETLMKPYADLFTQFRRLLAEHQLLTLDFQHLSKVNAVTRKGLLKATIDGNFPSIQMLPVAPAAEASKAPPSSNAQGIARDVLMRFRELLCKESVGFSAFTSAFSHWKSPLKKKLVEAGRRFEAYCQLFSMCMDSTLSALVDGGYSSNSTENSFMKLLEALSAGSSSFQLFFELAKERRESVTISRSRVFSATRTTTVVLPSSKVFILYAILSFNRHIYLL